MAHHPPAEIDIGEFFRSPGRSPTLADKGHYQALSITSLGERATTLLKAAEAPGRQDQSKFAMEQYGILKNTVENQEMDYDADRHWSSPTQGGRSVPR